MFVLSRTPSVASRFLAELRDVRVQKDRWRFRLNLERLGELLAYELSKTLVYEQTTVETPLGRAGVAQLVRPPVLAPVLRAGVPFYQGFLRHFDRADTAFVAAYRQTAADASFEVRMDYAAAPALDGRTLVVIDPMLATGRSLVRACQALLAYGTPAQLHVAVAIATPEGVAWVERHLPHAHLWCGAVDVGLNQKHYIVPGLGDAGDLAYGPKI